jgi:hypothetical protein
MEYAAVSEDLDRVRDDEARLVEVFYASTHEEAMGHYHERNGWEPHKPMPDTTDEPFTEDQLAEQEAYLAVRPLRWRAIDSAPVDPARFRDSHPHARGACGSGHRRLESG